MTTITDLVSDLLDVLEGVQARYDRDAAVRYARKYWEKVTSDGCIAVGGPYVWVKGATGSRFYHPTLSETERQALSAIPLAAGETAPVDLYQQDEVAVVPATARPCTNTGKPGPLESRFVPFTSEDGISLDDCTHFVSCCIGREPHERGGGLDVKVEFPGGALYGTIGPQRLLENLLGRGLAELVGSPNPTAAIPEPTADRSFIKMLKRGDVICYWFKPQKRETARYGHAAILITDGDVPQPKVACHSITRGLPDDMPPDRTSSWDTDWDLGDLPDVKYAFLHIKDGGSR